MNLGPLEIVVILVVALLVFGPKRLPEVGKQVGAALREIRKVQDTVRSEVNAVIQASPGPSPVASKPRALPVPAEEPDTAEPEPEGGTDAISQPPPAERFDPEPGFEGSPGSFS